MKTIIISLGGSLIVPKDIDVKFLKRFRKLILKFVSRGNRVILMCGGGYICRYYYNAAKKLAKLSSIDLDWLGVMATRLNGEFVRVIFGKNAYKKVLYNPQKKIRFNKILVMAGDKPGGSSDLDSVELALTYNINEIINLTDVDYVYNKNPKKYKNVKPLPRLTWQEYKKVIGGRFKSGMHVPFDPIASQKAMKHNLKVVVLKGNNIRNLKRFLFGRKFKGSIIS